VSPQWRDEVGIFLGPRRIVLNRMQRGLRPVCVAEHSVPVEGGGFNGWAPALAVLAAEMADSRWRGANARVVIANHWVRYAIVPWSADLADDAERLAHGRLLLQEVYGDAIDGWTVALGETTFGRAQLACAMPSDLQAELQLVMESAGLRLLSLQPNLVVSFNRWRRRMSPAGGWLVQIDEGTLAAVRLNGESWEEVHCVRIGTNWSAELKRLQTFGRLASGRSESARVLVEAPYWLRQIASETSESLEWLDAGDNVTGTLDRLGQIAGMHA